MLDLVSTLLILSVILPSLVYLVHHSRLYLTALNQEAQYQAATHNAFNCLRQNGTLAAARDYLPEALTLTQTPGPNTTMQYTIWLADDAYSHFYY